jgi:hypothetical protein
MSAVVGKNAITKDSESAYYSFADDREVFDGLINLPCISLNKKRKQQKSTNIVKATERNGHQCHMNRI